VENSRGTVENCIRSVEKLWNQWGKVRLIIRNMKYEEVKPTKSLLHNSFSDFSFRRA
jgi:hypothetical protein